MKILSAFWGVLIALVTLPTGWAFAALSHSRRDLFAMNVIMADAGTRLDVLRADLDTIGEKITAIIEDADDEDRDLNDEEITAIDKLKKKAERVTAQIEARNAVGGVSATRGRGRRSAPVLDDEGSDDDKVTATTGRNRGRRREAAPVPAEPVADRATMGFASFGQFAAIVHGAGIGEHAAHERFENVASTYGNEAVGAEGGYLVPPDFRTAIWEKVNAEDSLMSRTTEFVTGGNSITMPKDETTPWQQSGGLQAFWDGEGDTITQSKPKFELDTQRLNRLTGLVPVSEELLEDTIGLESYLGIKMPQKMDAKINTAIYRGTGVGQPLGIMNAASLITVSKESGQTADTVVFENVSKMWSRMYAPSRRNAVWLINQDIEPQLDQMAFPAGTGTAVPLYMPAGGMSASPFATLKGRPVVPIEPCSTLGDTGDMTLVDLTQYAMLKKAGEVRQDVSMHLYFDQNLMAFRFVFRLTGKPLWNSTIAPENGSQNRSWAVTLEDRA